MCSLSLLLELSWMQNLINIFFVGCGDSELGYRFSDDQNRKIIRSKDLIFNEGVLYKYRDTSFEAKKPELIQLKDFLEAENENSGTEDQERISLKLKMKIQGLKIKRT